MSTAAFGGSAWASSDVLESFPIASNGGTLIRTVDGKAYFVPLGANTSDSNDRVPAYSGRQTIVKIAPVPNGVVTHFSEGGAQFSPDGMNLGGGGGTLRAYKGSQKVVQIVPVSGGIVTRFSQNGVYRSPDGLNLGGGGGTRRAYSGTQQVVSMTAVDGGVVTLFNGGGAYFSPDGNDVGGGGETVRAYSGIQKIVRIVEMPQGAQTHFSGGNTYLSRTGRNLGGGGTTMRMPTSTKRVAAAEFGPRDSGSIAEFDGSLWLGSGFRRTNESYFDLWSSEDGARTWTLRFGVPTPEVGPRADFYEPYSPLVGFNGALWAIGSTVWRSTDGAQWAPVAAGPRRAVEDAEAMAFQGQIVYIDPQVGRVFVSPDGLDWSRSVDIPGFSPRCGAVITSGTRLGIWISGGGACDYSAYFSDTWYSDDAVNWTQIIRQDGSPKPVEWNGRLWPCVVTTPTGIMWMFGGFRLDDGVGSNLNDLWYSRDGSSWRQMPVSGGIEPRHAPSCSFDVRANALLVVAGKGGANPLNDLARVMNDVTSVELPLDEFLP